jgi:hypothetical protein
MKAIVSIFTLLLFLLLVGFAIESASGQAVQSSASTMQVRGSSTKMGNPQKAPVVKTAAAPKIVGYRAPEWKSVHTASQDEATAMIAALKKIGCEVDTVDHENHIDVKFRCAEWRSMKVATHGLQNQWATWCDSHGLETVVVNPPANTKRPTVSFRLPKARTVHLHDVHKAQQIINTLNLVGCEVKTSDHDGHIDATFSCPEWTTIELTSEDSAHGWQKWLNESGFETKHTHVN